MSANLIPPPPVTPLAKDHIVATLESSTAFGAIEELVAQLVAAGSIVPDAKGAVGTALEERERSMSTGIGCGVAIPHASTPDVSAPTLAFGRSKTGIDFNALDQQPVRLVMLVLVPAGQREKHLPTIARISRLFHRGEIRAALESAGDADAIQRVLEENLPA